MCVSLRNFTVVSAYVTASGFVKGEFPSLTSHTTTGEEGPTSQQWCSCEYHASRGGGRAASLEASRKPVQYSGQKLTSSWSYLQGKSGSADQSMSPYVKLFNILPMYIAVGVPIAHLYIQQLPR